MPGSGAEYPGRAHLPTSWDTTEDIGSGSSRYGEGKGGHLSASQIPVIKIAAVLGLSPMGERLLRAYGGLG